MTDLSGRTLGNYQILDRLGVGGMGEVYRARDTRIGRMVALKVLIGEHAESSELRARFEIEARAIAMLSHPSICTLFDVGEDGGTHFLVMELLEGETLAKRLERGALPVEQMLAVGAEIAGALAAAHRRGVIHRDLKPGNVMLTKGGVKLLDFGLARLHAASHGLDPAAAATRAEPLTAVGQVMGTFQYMSPEQVEGREADARSDIFALGAVLYEMASGKRPFDAASRASVMAAVLQSEPPAVTTTVPGLPARLDPLIRGCLAKDPDERWQSAADVGKQLRALRGDRQAGPAEAGARRRPGVREAIAWTLAVAAIAAAGALYLARQRPQPAPGVTRLTVLPPKLPPTGGVLEFGATGRGLALSPSGDRLAFVSRVGGVTYLWVWSFAEGTAAQLAGTDGASSPFWSPDGEQIGFFARGKLRRIAASGGPAATICDAPFGATGTWGRGGTIVFGEWAGASPGLRRVEALGGSPTPMTFDAPDMVPAPAWPEFLPDGRQLIFLDGTFKGECVPDDRHVWVADLETGRARKLVQADCRASYSSGHLLVIRGGTLVAVPFSPGDGIVTGEPVKLVGGVWAFGPTGGAEYTVAAGSPVLAYRERRPTSDLVWLDRAGRRLGTLASDLLFGRFRLSPDETQVATEIGDPELGGLQIHVLNARTGMGTRVTFEALTAVYPVWSPSAKELIFGAPKGSGLELCRLLLAGQRVDILLAKVGTQMPQDWSPDGRLFAFDDDSPGRAPQRQLWLLPMEGGAAPRRFLDVPFSTSLPRFSPDGRFLAYVGEESDRAEVFIAPVTAPGSRLRVSPAGGTRPRWTRGGRELVYQTLDDLLVAVPITMGSAPAVGAPDPLFRVDSFLGFNYEVTADGNRFLVNVVADALAERAVTIVSPWPDALAGRAARR
jgi:eukaryotic-like serine/threonine-protein kinase